MSLLTTLSAGTIAVVLSFAQPSITEIAPVDRAALAVEHLTVPRYVVPKDWADIGRYAAACGAADPPQGYVCIVENGRPKIVPIVPLLDAEILCRMGIGPNCYIREFERQFGLDWTQRLGELQRGLAMPLTIVR